MSEHRAPVINVLGTGVGILDLDEAFRLIVKCLTEKHPCRYMCVVDVHCIMQSFRRPEVRKAYQGALACVPDGMPLIWLGRAHGHRTMGRVYGPDLMLKTLALTSERGFSNFFCGGAEGVAQELAHRMSEQFPGLRVVGHFCPPFKPLGNQERRAMIQAINDAGPDLLWVGLGAPKQDLFMADLQSEISCKLMVGVGAAFDFHTGRIAQAPRWMMRIGLEWFFRFCTEPRRLGPRYIRNIPPFLWHVFLQESGLRRYPMSQ